MNVEFLPFNLNINSDYFNNVIPITISGTIAIERSLKGLKTVVAGEAWYKSMPGIILFNKIKKKEDLIKLNIKKNNVIKSKTVKFLKKQLNNKAIINAPGLGMLEKQYDHESIQEYRTNIKRLMKIHSK